MQSPAQRVFHREYVLESIEVIFESVLDDIVNMRPPVLSYVNRHNWDNATFDYDEGLKMCYNDSSSKVNIKFSSSHSLRNFVSTLHILSQIYILVHTNCYRTKREIYYQNANLYGCQIVVDKIVDDVACMLQVPRQYLHITATSKGCIAGNLQYIDVDGNQVDCSASKSGVMIPFDVHSITSLRSEACLVLIVEKDATFQKLLEDEYLGCLPPTIFITVQTLRLHCNGKGKGIPDLNTRQMVKKMWETLHIPVLALVDADPHGIEIMCIYRFGSLSSSYDCSNLAVPSVQWLGLLPSDVQRLAIPRTALLPLGIADRKKLHDLRHRPYCINSSDEQEETPTAAANAFAKSLSHQLDVMENQLNGKAEIECLYEISSVFLTASYLPSKIACGGWI